MTETVETQEARITVMESDGVVLSVHTYPGGGKAVLIEDAGFEHYQIQLFPTGADELGISVSAEISDRTPGRMANFTHDLPLLIGPEDILQISNDGLLKAMSKQPGAASLKLHIGLTLQLDTSYVGPIRQGILLARQLAKSFK